MLVVASCGISIYTPVRCLPYTRADSPCHILASQHKVAAWTYCLSTRSVRSRPALTPLQEATQPQVTKLDSSALQELARAADVAVNNGADERFSDYKPTKAFLFPGQGAQTVGMAKVRPGA